MKNLTPNAKYWFDELDNDCEQLEIYRNKYGKNFELPYEELYMYNVHVLDTIVHFKLMKDELLNPAQKKSKLQRIIDIIKE